MNGITAALRARAKGIREDIRVNHFPRVVAGLAVGYVEENQYLVGFDHLVRARVLEEEADRIDEEGTPRLADTNDWRVLSTIHHGDRLDELLAATCEDGIGVIARWTRRADGGWDVQAMDTEGGMQPVTDFHEGECVPSTPPTITAESQPVARADDDEVILPPAESDPRSAAWPQRAMSRREARKLGLIEDRVARSKAADRAVQQFGPQ